ncbi:hypothetical protein KXQ82_01115 [Mucilaginibacter sp. HMF5004]|uniref:hypothetical protein n=1 Tax=Mucilaginibacter rivuli TaxID=2857527 RepID=UPI001C5E35C5|nr:hypothetical protein [Mucilaginibacter rivuli]MBW4888289.1 hypothetical protein [Mucilaginibacter rivuli]
MSWSIIVAVICLVLLIFSVWKEAMRVNRGHLIWRMVAVTVAVAMLACIALPLTYTSTQKTPDEHRAVLLTDGFSVDSLKQYPGIPIFTTNAAIKKEYAKAILLNTLTEIKTNHPDITGLNIWGYGLDADELKQLDKMPVRFGAAVKPTGVATVNWNRELKSGEALTVQGHLNGDDGKPYQLILKGLNVTLDSITVKGNSDFELRSTPKIKGNAVYNLIAKSDKDTLESEQLPIHVTAVKPVRILILASSPDFENRFLKNWLSANSYAVHIRTAISKNKFSTEAINASQMHLVNLSAATFQNFDVILGDQLALQSLSAAESSALRQQVTQKGLGLIVRADSTDKGAIWFGNSFPLNRISGQTQSAAALQLSGKTIQTEKLVTDPVNIIYKEGTQILVSDARNKALVSTCLAGSGKVIFSTINNTYSWMLAGDENDYTAYWSLLISKAARKAAVPVSINLVDDFPQVNHETRMQVLSGSAPGQVSVAATNPAFVQSVAMPFLWSASIWPVKPGWQTVANIGDDGNDFYAFSEKDWKTIKNMRKIFVTNSYTKENLLNYTLRTSTERPIVKPISQIWFYLLLLAACSFLWAEAKFGSA